MRVLVINGETGDTDDTRTDRTGECGYLAGAIAKRGCEVVTAGSMHAGLAALGQVDVALLSVGSSRSSEVHVRAAVEAVRAESDLPLVVLAPEASPDRCAEALLAGADDYLARLVHIDELMARIQVLLRRRRGPHTSSWRLVAVHARPGVEGA